MNSGKYVFAQVVEFLSPNDFGKCVARYQGNFRIQRFTCWNQLLCMLFGQLTNRESLSDLTICLRSQRSKWYHLGLGTGISKSNLAHANEHRDWRIFADFAYILIAHARKICVNSHDFDLEIDGNIYAIDSTTIDLCLSVFWWAPFRKNKGAVKLHTQLEIKTEIPVFVHLSDGLYHDSNFFDELNFEPKAFYIMDRAYIVFDQFYAIHQAGAYFVTRLQVNQDYRRLYSSRVDKSTGVLCDQVIKLNNFYPSKDYPNKLRRIKYYDQETDKQLEFMTNNFELSALDIARLYKYRWKIELFFKWIKQHLKIKTFWGYSENAVRIQVHCAIIAYTVVAIIKHQCKFKHSTYELLQILSLTLLNKTPLNQLFDKTYQQSIKELQFNQLKMFN
jgi:Domain of unknown function (DUF4372)/Transposase DDE domain